MFTCSGIPRFWVPYLESRYENCMVLEHRVCYKLKMLKELLFGTPLLGVFVWGRLAPSGLAVGLSPAERLLAWPSWPMPATFVEKLKKAGQSDFGDQDSNFQRLILDCDKQKNICSELAFILEKRLVPSGVTEISEAGKNDATWLYASCDSKTCPPWADFRAGWASVILRHWDKHLQCRILWHHWSRRGNDLGSCVWHNCLGINPEPNFKQPLGTRTGTVSGTVCRTLASTAPGPTLPCIGWSWSPPTVMTLQPQPGWILGRGGKTTRCAEMCRCVWGRARYVKKKCGQKKARKNEEKLIQQTCGSEERCFMRRCK